MSRTPDGGIQGWYCTGCQWLTLTLLESVPEFTREDFDREHALLVDKFKQRGVAELDIERLIRLHTWPCTDPLVEQWIELMALEPYLREGVMKKPKSFKPGDTVVFDPSNFNPEYWENLSEHDRKEYYGAIGYGRTKPHLFTFLCEHQPQTGHCVLVSMEDQHIETMRHTTDFRLVTEEEA